MTETTHVAEFLELLPSQPERSFAETFLVGDRDGARAVTREVFLRALPARAELFAHAGIGTPVLDELVVTDLDVNYVLARARWSAPRADGGTVLLRASYLLHRGTRFQVVAYLNHQGPDLAAPPRVGHG